MGAGMLSSALCLQLLATALLPVAEASIINPTASYAYITTPAYTLATPIAIRAADASTLASSSSSSSSVMPSAIDNAPGGQANMDTPVSLVNYYFVFFALLLCVAGLGGFFIWRRRRKQLYLYSSSRQNALHTNLDAAEQRRQTRSYLGRWRGAGESREEGLDEHGEAPPPYVPKTQEEERLEREGGGAVTVPLQTLSREEAGLKPPEYMEAHARALRSASASASGQGGS